MGTGGPPAILPPTSYRIAYSIPKRINSSCKRAGILRSRRAKSFEDGASQLNRLVKTCMLAVSLRPCGQGDEADASSKFYDQAERAISICKLNVLPRLHLRPIKQVVFLCPS